MGKLRLRREKRARLGRVEGRNFAPLTLLRHRSPFILHRSAPAYQLPRPTHSPAETSMPRYRSALFYLMVAGAMVLVPARPVRAAETPGSDFFETRIRPV